MKVDIAQYVWRAEARVNAFAPWHVFAYGNNLNQIIERAQKDKRKFHFYSTRIRAN